MLYVWTLHTNFTYLPLCVISPTMIWMWTVPLDLSSKTSLPKHLPPFKQWLGCSLECMQSGPHDMAGLYVLYYCPALWFLEIPFLHWSPTTKCKITLYQFNIFVVNSRHIWWEMVSIYSYSIFIPFWHCHMYTVPQWVANQSFTVDMLTYMSIF